MSKFEDVECPYCDEWQEINHDDGQGYAEDEIHQQECNNCGKMFVFQTWTSHSYEASKADCLNDGEHDLIPMSGYPKALFVEMYRCKDCGEEVCKDPEAKRLAIAEYVKEMENQRLIVKN